MNTIRGSRRQFFVSVLLIGSGTAWAWQADRYTIQSGSRTESNGFELAFGSLVLRPRVPAISYGTVKERGGKRQFSCFVVMRHQWTGMGSNGTKFSGGVSGNKGHADYTFDLDGKKNSLKYELKLNDQTRTIVDESLTVDGKPLRIAEGRVLLVDLTVQPAKVEQVKVELPGDLPATPEPGSTEELSKKTFDTLEKSSPQVREFLKTARN